MVVLVVVLVLLRHWRWGELRNCVTISISSQFTLNHWWHRWWPCLTTSEVPNPARTTHHITSQQGAVLLIYSIQSRWRVSTYKWWHSFPHSRSCLPVDLWRFSSTFRCTEYEVSLSFLVCTARLCHCWPDLVWMYTCMHPYSRRFAQTLRAKRPDTLRHCTDTLVHYTNTPAM